MNNIFSLEKIIVVRTGESSFSMLLNIRSCLIDFFMSRRKAEDNCFETAIYFHSVAGVKIH